MNIERQSKELQLRVVELETSIAADAISSRNGDKRLLSQVDALQLQLDSESKQKMEMVRETRKTERLIKELQEQLQERDKSKSKYEDEALRYEEKIKRMKTQIDQLVRTY
jgi:predicted nuclease with TOPRIM domain